MEDHRVLDEVQINKILNLGDDCLKLWDSDGTVIDVSFAALTFFNAPSKENFHKRYAEILPAFQPDGKGSEEAFIKWIHYTLKHKSAEVNWLYRTLDGLFIDCLIQMRTTDYAGREIVYGLVSERSDQGFKGQESRALAQNIDERIHVMLDSAPIGCWFYNSSGDVIDCNQHAVNMFEMGSKGEMNRSHHSNNVPKYQWNGEDSMEYTRKALTKAFTEGQHKGMITLRSKSGREFTCEVTLIRVEYSGEYGVIAYLRETDVDFNLNKQMAAERIIKQRLQAMLDASPILCAVYDENYKVIEANRAAAHLFGETDKQVYVDRFADLCPDYQPDGSLSLNKKDEYIKLAFDTGHAYFEWMHCTLEGEPIPCEVHLERVSLDESYVVIAFARDLSEKHDMIAKIREKEIAEESSRAKSRFLARMSHEIRTPIASVLGVSEIQLQDPGLSPQVEEAFAKIHNSAGVLLNIVNDILDLSKIEADKMELLQEEYESVSMVNDIVHMHAANAESKDIKFNLYVDENLPARLIGDVLRIEQIANNLLSNAFKYTEAGTVDLAISYINEELVITIRDTGLGMSEEQLEILRSYKEYIRFHDRERRSISGTGLGMSIAYNLAGMMGAHIELESTVNEGTTVIVSIPQKAAGADILGREVAESIQSFEGMRFSSKRFDFVPEPMPYGRVLVVDDVDANLYVTKGLLSFYKLHVETCESGFDAIAKVQGGSKYDLIFMDHMMPGLDGVETLYKLRDMGYTGPIVVLTANALIGQAEEFIKKGFDGFISKPIQTKHLDAVLSKHIRGKSNSSNNSNIENFQNSAVVLEKLRTDFAVRHKDSFLEITRAAESGDFKNAYLLAHTLKGTAGLIQESRLVEAAQAVEMKFKEKDLPEGDEMAALACALARVLKDIGEDIGSFAESPALGILDQIGPLLESDDTGCLDLLDGLRGIPEAAIFVRLVEDFEFSAALKCVNALKDVLAFKNS